MDVGFIGSGNMAAAMARGWAQAGPDSPSRMFFTDSGSGRAAALAEETGGSALASNQDLVGRSEIVVLAVKPAALETVAGDLPAPAVLLSLLGATPLDRLAANFPGSGVFRLMPNLGVEVGKGVICMASDETLAEHTSARVKALLGSIASVHELDDGLIDAATAAMGCSPAYFAVIAEALVGKSVEHGLDPRLASRLVGETMAGTAELLANRSPSEVRGAVASPGGSTEAGLEALAEAGGAQAIRAAFEASIARMRGV